MSRTGLKLHRCCRWSFLTHSEYPLLRKIYTFKNILVKSRYTFSYNIDLCIMSQRHVSIEKRKRKQVWCQEAEDWEWKPCLCVNVWNSFSAGCGQWGRPSGWNQIQQHEVINSQYRFISVVESCHQILVTHSWLLPIDCKQRWTKRLHFLPLSINESIRWICSTNHESVSAVNHDVSPCFYSIK